MTYDRSKAIDYARRFWDRPCDDGVFWLTNEAINVERKRKELKAPAADGWEPRFVKYIDSGGEAEKAIFMRPRPGGGRDEILINDWAGLADCAHFLSRCLTAGGVKIAELGVPSLVAKLQARGDTKTLAEKVPRDRGQRIVDSGLFKIGDMVGYFNVSPTGDYGGRKEYAHSAMYTGKLPASGDEGHITCHTMSRFGGLSEHPDKWFLYTDNRYVYTFIHFSADDPPPSAATIAALPGWWKVQYAGRTEYYFILKDGRARYSLTAPKSAQAQLAGGDGSAYWFETGSTITFVWRNTGTMDVWTPGSGGNFSIVVNGIARGAASRMF